MGPSELDNILHRLSVLEGQVLAFSLASKDEPQILPEPEPELDPDAPPAPSLDDHEFKLDMLNDQTTDLQEQILALEERFTELEAKRPAPTEAPPEPKKISNRLVSKKPW